MEQTSKQASRKAYLEQLLGTPFTAGNEVRALHNGDAIFPVMLDAIHASRHSIEFLTYIYWTGDVAQEFARALAERARNGVKVKVLLDAYGCLEMKEKWIEVMKEAGVKVHFFRPARKVLYRYDKRTHRKVMVCDGKVAFTGGVGIAKEWEGDARNASEWREIHYRIEGPAVNGLRGAFWDNWAECDALPTDPIEATHPHESKNTALLVLRSGSDSRVSEVYKALHGLISQAEHSIDIITPYFVPCDDLLALLCKKARHGVQVRILLPGKYTDQRFERIESTRYYSKLTKCGVEVYLYQKTMIHTKLFLCDDDMVMFGSLNFNHRSVHQDEEIGVIANDPALNSQLMKSFEADLSDALPVGETEWAEPSLWQRVMHVLLKPLRKQL